MADAIDIEVVADGADLGQAMRMGTLSASRDAQQRMAPAFRLVTG